MSLKNRLDGHFVACSAAAAAAAVGGAVQSSEAAIVYNGTPINIPGTFAGVYINIFNGVNAVTPAGAPGWDLNPYDGGNKMWQGGAAGTQMVAAATQLLNLAPGTMIDATNATATGTQNTANFTAGVPGIVGFKFFDGTNTYFGWGRLSKGASATTAGTWVDFAYENTPNTGILAGAVPAPGSVALLALGALGMAGRRRK
jgi:hypothetical protein